MSDKTIAGIAAEIAKEAANVVEEYAPDYGYIAGEDALRHMSDREETWHQVNNARADAECVTWDGVILEAAYASQLRTEPESRRAGLVYLAAMVTAQIAQLDVDLAAFEE